MYRFSLFRCMLADRRSQFTELWIPSTMLSLHMLFRFFLEKQFSTEPLETCTYAYVLIYISNSGQVGRILHQYVSQLWVPAWHCALPQTEGALWWRSVSRHQNVWQCAVGPEKKSPERCIISWDDNSMETLRPTGKTHRNPSQDLVTVLVSVPTSRHTARVQTGSCLARGAWMQVQETCKFERNN